MTERKVRARLLTVPNTLSFLRLPLALAFMLTASPAARAAIIVVASITDGLDGWLARRWRQDTGAGQIVDPITDKLFVLVALATLVARGELEPWMIVLLLTRDIYTSFAFLTLLLLEWHVHFKARWSGKTVTVLQMSVMLAALLLPWAVLPLVIATAAASLVAIADYTRVILAERRQAR
jgi:CDP-diacylglycerol--glycerol-3-phosphate 3-phosphatidyltransferase/cardiolipin synthase